MSVIAFAADEYSAVFAADSLNTDVKGHRLPDSPKIARLSPTMIFGAVGNVLGLAEQDTGNASAIEVIMEWARWTVAGYVKRRLSKAQHNGAVASAFIAAIENKSVQLHAVQIMLVDGKYQTRLAQPTYRNGIRLGCAGRSEVLTEQLLDQLVALPISLAEKTKSLVVAHCMAAPQFCGGKQEILEIVKERTNATESIQ